MNRLPTLNFQEATNKRLEDIKSITGTETIGVVVPNYVGGGATGTGNVLINPVNHIQFQLTPDPVVVPAEGMMWWNENDKTVNVKTEKDTIIQVGQELVIRGTNKTGSTLTNGQVVYVDGAQGNRPTFALAKADAEATSTGTLGFVTSDILNDDTGYVTVVGLVRDIETGSFSAGDMLYLSGATAGAYTNVKPDSPIHLVTLGYVTTAAASPDGVVLARIINGPELDELHDVLITAVAEDDSLIWDSATSLWVNKSSLTTQFFDGSILETIDLVITSAAGTITASLQADGGGDLTCRFGNKWYNFDCTPSPATIALTPGTDTVPVLNTLYLTESGGTVTLNKSLTSWPSSGQYCPIGQLDVKSAAQVAVDGCLAQQNMTDHIIGTNNNGHLSHVNEKLRVLGTAYQEGVAPTLSVGGTSQFSNASGVVYQLHDQVFPALDMGSGDPCFIVNDFTTKYLRSTEFVADIDSDSTGTSLGKYFTIVIWATASKSGSGNSHLFCNLPSGSYNTSASSIADNAKYTNFSIPSDYRGTGFLIAAYTISETGGNWSIEATQDLRGEIPSIIAGGGLAVGQEFQDETFRVQDTADTTKEMEFECDGITTGTIRTLTVQDADGTIAYTSDLRKLHVVHCAQDTLWSPGLVGVSPNINTPWGYLVHPSATSSFVPSGQSMIDGVPTQATGNMLFGDGDPYASWSWGALRDDGVPIYNQLTLGITSSGLKIVGGFAQAHCRLRVQNNAQYDSIKLSIQRSDGNVITSIDVTPASSNTWEVHSTVAAVVTATNDQDLRIVLTATGATLADRDNFSYKFDVDWLSIEQW